MKRLAVVALTGFFAATGPLWAADIDIDAPIRAVVVFPQTATVTRESAFSVPAGVSTLVIDHLPPGFDTSTIRVDGGANVPLEIRSVEAVTARTTVESPERARLTNAIDDLRDQHAALGDQLTALQGQRTFIQNLIAEGPGGFATLLGTQGTGVDQWATAWQAIGRGLDEVLTAIREVSDQQRALEEQIADLTAQMAALPQPKQEVTIRVEVATDAAATGTLTTRYQVANASWAPAYDVTLTTGATDVEPAIELVRRAEITQTTGEDWTNVALTLSTTRPTGGTAAPVLGEGLLRIFDARGRNLGTAAAPAPAPIAAEAADLFGGIVAPVPVTETQAVADFGDFRADFIIPDPVSVASGGGSRSVRISTDTAPARLFATTTPRLAEQAFLTAAFTLDSEAPLLAGRANLFRDGSYVGRAAIAFANPGEEVELGFGADDQVRVTWTLVSRDNTQRGLLTRLNASELHYEAVVENLHTRAMSITVVDRIPVAEDARIVVEALPAGTTPPTETDVDGRRGVLAWTYDYAPGETRTIDNAYVVTWPADLTVTGLD